MGDIPMPMDTTMESVKLNQKQRLKLIQFFCMEDIMDIILDMLDITDIPMPTMESVKLNQRPRLKLIPTFSMVDMDTILDMLDTMDMLDIPTPAGVKSSLATR